VILQAVFSSVPNDERLKETETNAPLLAVRLPGRTSYGEAWALQRAVHEQVADGSRPATLLLLEHPRTLTMGRRGGWLNLRSSRAELIAAGYELWQVDRGGDVTYHGPGQLVGYPIVNLEAAHTDVIAFVRALEQASIGVLRGYGVDSQAVPKLTGVWCGERKITAIGVRVSRWTSMHGFAINLTTELGDFDHIVPCGLVGKSVTSLTQELARISRAARVVDLEEVAVSIAERLADELGLGLEWATPQSLPEPSSDLRVELESFRVSGEEPGGGEERVE